MYKKSWIIKIREVGALAGPGNLKKLGDVY